MKRCALQHGNQLGGTGSELSFVIDGKAREQFSIGTLERDKDNYFVKIHDDYLDQNHVVKIPEEKLRERGFTGQLRAANSAYEARIEDEERVVKMGKKLRKSRFKKALVLAGISLAMATSAKIGHNYLNNPERLQRIEAEKKEEERLEKLDDMAIAIIPDIMKTERYKIKSERQEYKLGENTKVDAYLIDNYSDKETLAANLERLLIIKNNSEEFISDYWSSDADDDARVLI